MCVKYLNSMKSHLFDKNPFEWEQSEIVTQTKKNCTLKSDTPHVLSCLVLEEKVLLRFQWSKEGTRCKENMELKAWTKDWL
jgi:hypothetical protein